MGVRCRNWGSALPPTAVPRKHKEDELREESAWEAASNCLDQLDPQLQPGRTEQRSRGKRGPLFSALVRRQKCQGKFRLLWVNTAYGTGRSTDTPVNSLLSKEALKNGSKMFEIQNLQLHFHRFQFVLGTRHHREALTLYWEDTVGPFFWRIFSCHQKL